MNPDVFAARVTTEIEIIKKLQPPDQMLSGWAWFEWGLQRALAIAENRDEWSIAWAALRSKELDAKEGAR